MLASFALAGEHILQVLPQYYWVSPQYLVSIVTIRVSIEHVNTPKASIYGVGTPSAITFCQKVSY